MRADQLLLVDKADKSVLPHHFSQFSHKTVKRLLVAGSWTFFLNFLLYLLGLNVESSGFVWAFMESTNRWICYWIRLCCSTILYKHGSLLLFFFTGQSTSERTVLCLMACLSSASSPPVAPQVSLSQLGTLTEDICTSYLWLNQPVFFCRSQPVQWSWTDSRPTSPWTGPEDFTTPRSPRPPDSVTSMTLCWPSWSCSSRF